MIHPDQDVLAAIALGEPTDEEVLAHIANCVECQSDIDGYAEVVTLARGGPSTMVEPPNSVWDRIEADLDATPEVTSGRSVEPRQAPKSAKVLRWAVAAGVAGLLLGGIGMRMIQRDTAPSDVVVSRTSLTTLDTKAARGEADLVRTGDALALQVTTQPMEPDGGYLEVWLINKDLKRMVSVGVLPGGRTQERFVVPQQLIDAGYVIVDISREQFDDKPQHSGDSLVRGVLA